MATPGLTPPLLAPIYLPGQEPMPAGTTPQEREEFRQMMKWQGWMNGAMESCPLKTVLSGGAGMSPHHRICVLQADDQDSRLEVSSHSCRQLSHMKIHYHEQQEM
jgi:hypothetical protein